MNHSQLRAFHAVAVEGSFTKAANALRVSQPTLSGHVKALEEGYGVELFERGGRSIQLTEFGRTLLEVTGRYFASEREAERLLATAKGLLNGRLRVGADSPYYVVPLLAQFSRRYPRVQKSLSFGNSKEVLEALFAHRCEIGIVPEIAPDDRLLAVQLKRDRLVVFVNTSHAWAKQRSVRLGDLAGQTVLLRERGSTTRAIFESALGATGVTLEDTLELGSREAIREAVAEGLGVSIVGEGELGHDDRLHKLSVRDANLNVVEFAACLHERKSIPEVSAFMELAKEAGQK
ncbi:MAG: LysR substrate-binding domain-containing protein [Hyphomicrobiales bacterium]